MVLALLQTAANPNIGQPPPCSYATGRVLDLLREYGGKEFAEVFGTAASESASTEPHTFGENSEWKVYTDEVSGHPYWYNERTQESYWVNDDSGYFEDDYFYAQRQEYHAVDEQQQQQQQQHGYYNAGPPSPPMQDAGRYSAAGPPPSPTSMQQRAYYNPGGAHESPPPQSPPPQSAPPAAAAVSPPSTASRLQRHQRITLEHTLGPPPDSPRGDKYGP